MSNLEKEENILVDTFKKGDFLKCVELAEVFVKKYPHKGNGYNILALSYNSVGRTNEAIKIFLFLIQKLPKLIAYKSNLGNLVTSISAISSLLCFELGHLASYIADAC